MTNQSNNLNINRILIVEDEIPFARALALKLQSNRFETDIAKNGQEAMTLLAQNKYELILLDIIMPGMDGFTVLSRLKELAISPPVIVISQLAQPEDIKRVKKLGVLHYFVKFETPISQIVQYVKKVLKKN